MRPIAFVIALFLVLGCCNSVFAISPVKGDIVIRNGRIVDGTGDPSEITDVVIRDDKILSLGKVLNPLPEGVMDIDASGKIVSPGFIDTHSHGNPVDDPELLNFLAMGVTTICLGQDGSSVPVGRMRKFFEDIETTVPGTNVLTFVGHGTVRTESGIRLSTTPTLEQITSMTALVEQGLELGAWGLTTGLEYQPGMFSTPQELAAIAEPVGKRGLVVMSHMRNEDDDQLSSSIRELVEQCRASGARAHVSHIKSVYGKGAARAEEILKVLEEARATGVNVSADIYPYTASHTGLSILFPRWALPPNSYNDATTKRRTELVQYLHDRVAKRNGPEATLLGNGPNAGKTLADLAKERGKPYAEVLADLGPRGGSAAYFVMDEELQSNLLIADGINICSDGGSGSSHPRSYGTFAKVIRKYVNEDKTLSLEKAIHKMSGLPAKTIGLDKANRGTIAAGNYADILIFDPAKVKDTATYENPKQLAEGIDTIIVNGAVIRKDGQFMGKRAGRLLKRFKK